MSYIPTHLYIVTGDKRFEKSYRKEQRFNVWGIAISGAISLGAIWAGFIYCLVIMGG